MTKFHHNEVNVISVIKILILQIHSKVSELIITSIMLLIYFHINKVAILQVN